MYAIEAIAPSSLFIDVVRVVSGDGILAGDAVVGVCHSAATERKTTLFAIVKPATEQTTAKDCTNDARYGDLYE